MSYGGGGGGFFCSLPRTIYDTRGINDYLLRKGKESIVHTSSVSSCLHKEHKFES